MRLISCYKHKSAEGADHAGPLSLEIKKEIKIFDTTRRFVRIVTGF
jgi:hypothetical protein